MLAIKQCEPLPMMNDTRMHMHIMRRKMPAPFSLCAHIAHQQPAASLQRAGLAQLGDKLIALHKASEAAVGPGGEAANVLATNEAGREAALAI